MEMNASTSETFAVWECELAKSIVLVSARAMEGDASAVAIVDRVPGASEVACGLCVCLGGLTGLMGAVRTVARRLVSDTALETVARRLQAELDAPGSEPLARAVAFDCGLLEFASES